MFHRKRCPRKPKGILKVRIPVGGDGMRGGIWMKCLKEKGGAHDEYASARTGAAR